MAIFALGFESRATNLVHEVVAKSDEAIALGFDHGHEGAYQSNLNVYQAAKVDVTEALTDTAFEATVVDRLTAALPRDAPASVFVDISCFSRFRLAAIVNALFAQANFRTSPLVIDFAYSLAEFEEPPSERRPNAVVGPAHGAFAGWSQGNYSSTATVLGLGYEQDQAMGVVEYLQAGEVWAFTPNSPVEQYKPQVAQANELLLAEIPPSHVIEYDVCAPASTVATMESVVRGLSDKHSVVLVPFGPKIFVLCSLIVAALRRDVAVWRVSQGSHIEPQDRRASEISVGLRLTFARGLRES